MIFKHKKINNMKNTILTSSLLLFFTLGINAQNNKLLKAFEQSYSHEKNMEFTKAAHDLEVIYPTNMANYELNLRLGWLTYLSGNFKESEKFYSKAITLKPFAIEAIYGNILPLLGQKKYTDVIQLANKALTIAPNDSKAEYFIGLANYYKKDYLKAEKYLEKAINKYPFDLDINLMLGWTKFALGKKNEAKLLFQIAQRNAPNSIGVKTALEIISK